MIYKNRREAGQLLGKALVEYDGADVVVLALPRGGVVVGAEVARRLRASLGVVLVRKIGHPNNPEYAIGAVAEGGISVYNEDESGGLDVAWLKQAEASALELIEKRRKLYYGGNFLPPAISDKVVIIVDDGIATGITMDASVRAVQKMNPKEIIVAVPVASRDSTNHIKKLVSKVIVLDDPNNFLNAVGAHYLEFNQINDQEVRILLREVNHDIQQTFAAY